MKTFSKLFCSLIFSIGILGSANAQRGIENIEMVAIPNVSACTTQKADMIALVKKDGFRLAAIGDSSAYQGQLGIFYNTGSGKYFVMILTREYICFLDIGEKLRPQE